MDGGIAGGGGLVLPVSEASSSGSLNALTTYKAITKFTTRTETIALQHIQVKGEGGGLPHARGGIDDVTARSTADPVEGTRLHYQKSI